MVFVQGGEAADEFLQILHRKIIRNLVDIFSTRVHPEGILASLQRLHSNPKEMCNDLHTRQFCPVGVLKFANARNQSISGCPFFGCSFGVPGFAPLNFFGSIEGCKTIFLGIRRLVFNVKPFFAPALDGDGKFHIKIVDIGTDADTNATYVVDDVFRVVAPEIKDAFPEAPMRVDA